MKWLFNFFSKLFKKEDLEKDGEQVMAVLTSSEAYENYKKVVEAKNLRIKYSMERLISKLDGYINNAVSDKTFSACAGFTSEEILIDEITRMYTNKGYKVKIEDYSGYGSDDKKITVSFDHFKR